MAAAPTDKASGPVARYAREYEQRVECPWCESINCKLTSPFGGTVSEMLFQCRDCDNTFGWMKWEHKKPKG